MDLVICVFFILCAYGAHCQSDFRSSLGSNEAFIGVIVAIVVACTAVVVGILVIIIYCVHQNSKQQLYLKEKRLEQERRLKSFVYDQHKITVPDKVETKHSKTASHGSGSKYSTHFHSEGNGDTGYGSASNTFEGRRAPNGIENERDPKGLYRASSLIKPGSHGPQITGKFPSLLNVSQNSTNDRSLPRTSKPEPQAYYYSQTAINHQHQNSGGAITHNAVRTQPLDVLNLIKSDPTLNINSDSLNKRASYVERQMLHSNSHNISDQIFSVPSDRHGGEITRRVSALPRTPFISAGTPTSLRPLDETKAVKNQAPPVPSGLPPPRPSRVKPSTNQQAPLSPPLVSPPLVSPPLVSPPLSATTSRSRHLSEMDDMRSVSSHQLKQEAIQAFEFLDSYENDDAFNPSTM